MFCTYGVILRVLQNDRELCGVKYIILDEVHERGIESDFALALLLDTLKLRRSSSNPIKLILMSATIQTEKFQQYLSKSLKTPSGDKPIPVLAIAGRAYPVSIHYLGELLEPLYGSQERPWHRKGDIEYDVIAKLVLHLRDSKKGYPSEPRDDILFPASGTILIFLPGVAEISKLIRVLDEAVANDPSADKVSIRCLPLHGSLSPSDQRRVFESTPQKVLRVVAATNIAEASITIPDVSVVIDTCRAKEMNFFGSQQVIGCQVQLISSIMTIIHRCHRCCQSTSRKKMQIKDVAEQVVCNQGVVFD
jgi:ATP-dependent RNA helicase DHX57